MKKPAVSPLADSDWVDLITVVDESAVRSLIPRPFPSAVGKSNVFSRLARGS